MIPPHIIWLVKTLAHGERRAIEHGKQLQKKSPPLQALQDHCGGFPDSKPAVLPHVDALPLGEHITTGDLAYAHKVEERNANGR